MSLLEKVSKHSTASDCWMSYKGKVLDVTGFIDSHPGGGEILNKYYGKDITAAFHEETDHSETAERILECLVISEGQKAKPTIDPKKGVAYQILKNLSAKEYEDFINSPHHVDGHVRVFDSSFCEFFSITP